MGLKTTGRETRKEIVVRETGPFVVNQVRLEQLGITPREHEILTHIAGGLSTREIAEKLFVSENTVKTHSSRLFDDHSYIVGYTGIVAAFLLVYFGVRSYRDNVLGRRIGFGRAFTVGLLIATIGSICYVATWEILYYKFMPDFYSRFAQSAVEQARKDGKSDEEIAKTQVTMEEMTKNAKNPAWVAAA